MGFLQNTWVRYVVRTYQQIKDTVLTEQQSRVSEITDHTESNLFVKMLDIWAGIAEMLGYYTDNAAREAHLDSCRLYKSGIQKANQHDYRVRAKVPASANLKFNVNAISLVNIVIPIGTRISNADGLIFTTTQPAILTAGQLTVTVPAKQYDLVTGLALGISSGEPKQIIILPDGAADNSASVRVNNIAWTKQQTLGLSIHNSEHYIFTVNSAKQPILRFGNGMNGKIPPAGQTIDCDYYVTVGSRGNVGAGTLINMVNVITVPVNITITVSNPERASGGSDFETLAQLKQHIPLSIRTQERAVTPEDYRDVTNLASGVYDSKVYFDCGKSIGIYIVPDNGGIASGSLVGDTQVWINNRKMVTTKVNMFPAGELRLQLVITLNVKNNYQASVVSAAVTSNLLIFLSYLNQEIEGMVFLSDLYQTIDNTDGVNNSIIERITPVPYANPANIMMPALNWTRSILSTSVSVSSYKIKMFTGTQYQVFRNNAYVEILTVGGVFVNTEITFSVGAGSYTANDEWNFVVYPFNNLNLMLQEPSVPVSLLSDIALTVNGGF